MHVALCHDAIIPPAKYGGTERIVDWLARALSRLGHRTTVLAAEGSRVPGSMCIPHPKDGDWEAALPADVDVLHLWATPRTPPRRPFVVTIEGNGRDGERFHPNTIFISRRHAENHGARNFVYNGIEPDEYACLPDRGDHLVFLAKASWSVKNLKGAIAVARAARLPLEVLGSRDWPLGLHRALPRIRGVRYRGMVGDAEKREVLSRARALLFPVRWHEPFGIAMAEALASGCPVFGTPYGSLPEIVSSDVGVLSADGAELARALAGAPRFDPLACRARVLDRFSSTAMARGYLHQYESVLRTGRLAEADVQAPATRPGSTGLSSKSLLEWNQPA